MENSLKDSIILGVSIVAISAFVSVIAWTFVIGFSIASSFQNQVVNSYNYAGMDKIIEFTNEGNIDAPNVYKMLEENRNSITSFTITNSDGTYTRDPIELLNRPTAKFTINFIGDYSTGFQLQINQVPPERAGP